MHRKIFGNGSILHCKGDEAVVLYELIRGKLTVCNHSKEGKEFWVGQLNTGDTFGEAALIDGKSRTNTVIAQTEAETALLSKENFDELRKEFNEISSALLLVNVGYLRRANEILDDIGTLSVGQRLVKLICRLIAHDNVNPREKKTWEVNISQEGLGRMLGASRQSISKELLLLRQDEIIDIHREKLIVKELDKLLKLAS